MIPFGAITGTALAVAAVSVAAAIAAANTCNGLWCIRAGAAIVMVGVPLQVWDYMTKPNAGAMSFYRPEVEFRRARAAIVALVCGTALQGLSEWL